MVLARLVLLAIWILLRAGLAGLAHRVVERGILLLERLRALLRGIASARVILLLQGVLRGSELLAGDLLSALADLLQLLALRRVHPRLVPARARKVRCRLTHLVSDGLLPIGVLLGGGIGLAAPLARLLSHLRGLLRSSLRRLLCRFRRRLLLG